MSSIAVIGAGQMGAGIAQVSAQAGYQVLLSDREISIAECAKAYIGKMLARAVEKGKMEEQAASVAMDRITPVGSYEPMASAELIIEAATEREDVKRAIFDEVGKVLGHKAVLASNTSSIPITRMAQATPDAARFVGVHFFNPVPVMGLIEVIRGLATSDETVEKVESYAAAIGKKVVHANDAPGFIVNRILLPMLNEACFALGEGVASIPDIDAAITMGLNHPMGPLTLADFIGLDTCLHITNVLYSSTGDPKYRAAPLLVKYVEAGWLGRKTKRGFYDYSGDAPVPTR
ncbi:3-hydroxyacyl-CoA dehydrogenase NAD-binding domain-containing protein [Alterisphingorhabdus coralli]|uniref:3-hydroxyacyl-CoA dehydrogenase NAD-binding domain-containing protein n=1 Tax=Alterisphingorhabdus coralli TaxID=3071408 RepID=A0AA97F7I9_9SPHN|nr:3-hydroxyacyl-CoA dehydrogenase NAD-binding domain-containing protein [Parasphingorhabdus sp. SCSIO 66989]WOE75819.1 3-hydroxyacyl-CoA dehydrogenase NAD-binding domain-containing protein [Parasphingorhabdus sp. SCSIO 66989]